MTRPPLAILVLLVGVSIPGGLRAGPMPDGDRRALAARSIGFAAFLLENRQAPLAVVEYQRCLWYAEGDSSDLRAVAVNGVARAYARSEAYEEVLRWAETPVVRAIPACRLDTLHLEAARAALKLGSPDLAHHHLGAIGDSCPLGPATVDRKAFLLGIEAVHAARWTEAERLFRQVRPEGEIGLTAAGCATLARSGESLPRKNPALAGWLAVLPGAGYFYGGFHGTGLSSLVVNVALAVAATESFRTGRETSGGIFTALAATWYVGGIYGSAQGARRYNAHHRDALTRRFEY